MKGFLHSVLQLYFPAARTLRVRLLAGVLGAVLFAFCGGAAHAEDIDIYAATPSSADLPNVIIALDNSSNWAAANQNWPTDSSPPVPCGNDCNKQGYYELKAIRSVILGLPVDSSGDLKVNLGFVLFNNSNATRDGAYVRYHVRRMTAANKSAFLAKIDEIIQNFNTETGPSSVQYAAMLFDLFKYFGGHTNPANAGTGDAPSTNPTYDSIAVFGLAYWGSNNADGTKPDSAAYSGANYVPAIASDCAKNYVIFIGNGFPAKDNTVPDMGDVLKKLTNPASPPATISEFKVDTVTTNTTYGNWTDLGSCQANCSSTLPTDTASVQYRCVATGCSGGQQKPQSLPVTTTPSTTYGTWTDVLCMPTASCVAPANTSTMQYQCVQSACGAGLVTVQSRSVTSSTTTTNSDATVTTTGSFSTGTSSGCSSANLNGNVATCPAPTTSSVTSGNQTTATTTTYSNCTYGTGGNCSPNVGGSKVYPIGATTRAVRTLVTTTTPLTFGAWADTTPACVDASAQPPTPTSTVDYQAISTGCPSGQKKIQTRTITTTTTVTPNGSWTDIPTCSASCNPPASTATIGYQCAKSTCSGSDKQVQWRTITTSTTTTTAAPSGDAVDRYADEYADFLFRTDVSSRSGQQNVVTYAIDVCKDQCNSDQESLLRNVAKYGGGKYCKATTEAEIIACFQDAMVDILAVNSVFASASLPVSTQNQSRNENQVYIGVFRPDPQSRPRWLGNLKRYQFGFTSATEISLVGLNGEAAINNNTGFIGDCVASFWTANPSNSTAYWSGIAVNPPPIGHCASYRGTVYDQYGDLPDGPFVEKGSVSQVLRMGNNPPYSGSGANTPTFAVNRTTYTLNSSGTGLEAYTDANPNGLHARGYDQNNERPGGSTATPSDTASDARPSIHGDVVHSRPLPVNFGTDKIAIYYGANDGMFRAVNAFNGKEMWSFLAPEFTGAKLTRLLDNTPLVEFTGQSYPSGTSIARKDYFFDGGLGLLQTLNNAQVWIYPSMRRGGRMVYGFDVGTTSGSGNSFSNTPSFKWRFGCNPAGTCYAGTGTTTDSNVVNIGQTWSTPVVAPLKLPASSTVRTVIFGGGYDACEDANTATPSCSGTTGQRVYVVNADTGALIRAFTVDRAAAADVWLVDTNIDGYVDYAYVLTTGGSVYRINFVNSGGAELAAADWDIQKIAFTTGGGRKFLFPTISLNFQGKVYLAFGSGDREHPLASDYPYTWTESNKNRFYVYLDDPVARCPSGTVSCASQNLDDTSTMQDVTADPGCETSSNPVTKILPGSTKKGWFMDLARGEQVVTSAVIAAGNVSFSTNTPTPAGTACTSSLGEARGYSVSLLTGSGAIGVDGSCGGARSQVFAGGGLPPSPVIAPITVKDTQGNDVRVTICIGCPGTSPIGGTRVNPTIPGRRTKVYWYSDSDKK